PLLPYTTLFRSLIGPQLPGFGLLLLALGGGDDASAQELRDLDAGAAYTAAGPPDKHVFSGLHAGPGHQHVPGGQEDQRQRRRFGVAQEIGRASRRERGE